MTVAAGTAAEATTFYTYDGAGNLLTVSDPRRPGLTAETYTYDARNRPVTETTGPTRLPPTPTTRTTTSPA